MSKIRLRILVDPLEDEQTAYHCDMWISESDLAIVDREKGMEIFMERYIAPGLYTVLEQFAEPFGTIEELMERMKKENRSDLLPRSIEFYRQKLELERLRKAAA